MPVIPGSPNLDPTPLTPQTFWTAHHYANNQLVDEEAEISVLNPDLAFLSEAAIGIEESRLGITLPAGLRALYAIQNGGSGMGLYVPCPIDMHNMEEGWINPFSGYDDMYPLTSVHTLRESILNYASEEETELFPSGCERMILLARWYGDALFLDYRGRKVPRVGFMDLDDDDDDFSMGQWAERALWWDDFDAFFSQLRKQNPQ